MAKLKSNLIVKFANDTTVVGFISNNNKTSYREEVEKPVNSCHNNNLSLNVDKTKEVVVGFRKGSDDHPPLLFSDSVVERVSSTKFLGVYISDDLTWTTNTNSTVKKFQQPPHFLRRLKRANNPPPILTTFHR